MASKLTTGELLPCPFCGGDAILCSGVGEFWGRCLQCDASGHAASVREAAIAAWNRRPAVLADEGLREAVARIVDPQGWATHDRQTASLNKMAATGEPIPPEAYDGPNYYTRDSLTKADAILRLLPHVKTEGSTP